MLVSFFCREAPLLFFSHTSLLSLSPSPQQLGEEIGRGSSGKVYRALNRETGDFRAIKEIPTRNMPPGHLEAIQSEIDLLHTLQHDQIVRYFETIRTEGHLYLVLEYVENGSLATLIKNFGAFPEHLVCVYVRQLLRGLEWLHEQGVCHRDIKGANLLITKDGQVKLADFGVARKISESGEQQAAVVGTPYWMAPEVIQMSAFTTASDIWSLGCTILELLNGEPPYYDLKQITALYRIVQDEHPPLPADLSPALTDFLMTCFTRNPDRRPTASALRQHQWLVESDQDGTGGGGGTGGPQSGTMPQRIGQLAVMNVTTLGQLPRNYSVGRGGSTEGYDSEEGSTSQQEEHGSRDVSRQDPSIPPSLHGSRGGSRQLDSRGGSRQESHPSLSNHSRASKDRPGDLSPRLRPDDSPAHSRMMLEPPLTPPLLSQESRQARAGSSSRGSRGPLQHGQAPGGRASSNLSREGSHGNADRRSNSGSGSSGLPFGSPGQTSLASASATALASRDRVEALRAIENQSERKVRHDSRNLLERGPSGGDSSNEPSYDSRRESGGGGGAPVASQSRESPQAVRAPGSPAAGPSPYQPRPPAASITQQYKVQGLELPPSVVQHDYNQVAQASQVQQYQQMELPPSLQQQQPGGYSADLEGPVSPYPYSSLRALQTQQQQALNGVSQMPLVGFLWKRGSSWRSFAYQRRFFYLTEDALCYSKRPLQSAEGGAGGGGGGVPTPALNPGETPPGEKRILLSSVTHVRMHSKLKYEFELVCTNRSYRLRAPSAQALALWVTAISSEWLQLSRPGGSESQPQTPQMVPASPPAAAFAPQMPPQAQQSMPPQQGVERRDTGGSNASGGSPQGRRPDPRMMASAPAAERAFASAPASASAYTVM